jgi:hypothetical protein
VVSATQHQRLNPSSTVPVSAATRVVPNPALQPRLSAFEVAIRTGPTVIVTLTMTEMTGSATASVLCVEEGEIRIGPTEKECRESLIPIVSGAVSETESHAIEAITAGNLQGRQGGQRKVIGELTVERLARVVEIGRTSSATSEGRLGWMTMETTRTRRGERNGCWTMVTGARNLRRAVVSTKYKNGRRG